ncbi:hypothetical protein GGI11_008198, partial [Coemansia sp. RSA 2049]
QSTKHTRTTYRIAHTATRRLEAEGKCGRGEGVRGPAKVRPGARTGEHGPRGE